MRSAISLEEGTHSAWLHKLIKPLVASVMVCDPRYNKLIEDGNKSDDDDAETLAQLLRIGAVKDVYKGNDQQQELKPVRSLACCIRLRCEKRRASAHHRRGRVSSQMFSREVTMDTIVPGGQPEIGSGLESQIELWLPSEQQAGNVLRESGSKCFAQRTSKGESGIFA